MKSYTKSPARKGAMSKSVGRLLSKVPVMKPSRKAGRTIPTAKMARPVKKTMLGSKLAKRMK